MKFKQQHPFENRKKESDRVIEKYPDRIPVIVERTKKAKVPNIDRNKFLVPNNLTMGQLVYVIRKRIRIEAEKAIFLFVNKQILCNTSTLSEVYARHSDNDGFLYVEYMEENVFG